MRKGGISSDSRKQRALRKPALALSLVLATGLNLFLVCSVGGDAISPSGAANNVFEVVPLAVTDGTCEFVLRTPNPADQFYLIVGSLDKSAPTNAKVRTEVASGPERLPLENTEPDAHWRANNVSVSRRLERQRRQRPAGESFPPLAAPPAVKKFHLFLGERDLSNPDQYQAVEAELTVIGKRVQVYLDKKDHALDNIDATSAAIARLFDDEVAPWADDHLGRVCDVDRDGRFTVLLTSKLGSLQNGHVPVDGFVRASDFVLELPPPFSNRCDMLYLNSKLKPGPQLRTVLAHEYTHAATFCEHGLRPYGGKNTNTDEESWLSEGLAHLVESTRGLGWSNLDYRVSAYLAEPERFPLIVPDYFGAGLWRNPGLRGAAYLFLRSCLTHADQDLPRRLVQSPLRGAANLEVATRKPFAALFRQACVDLLKPCNYGYLDVEQAGAWLCGPHFQELSLQGASADAAITPTAAAFFLLHSPAAEFTRVRVEATGSVQVTLVRVPTGLPRLSLNLSEEQGRRFVQVSAHHYAVQVQRAGWEGVKAVDDATHDQDGRWILPGETVYCPIRRPTEVAGAAPMFKVWGQDRQGRPVAAWLRAKPE